MSTITIITVTRNDIDGLKLTAKSILPRLNSNIMWIIVDGASSDGSVELIESLKNYIYWSVSEPDKGIYDAMNKGAFHAPKDSFLIWINSGDQLLTIPEITGEYDSYFFGVVIKETGFHKLPFIHDTFGVKSISPYSQYYHQGYLVRCSVFLQYMYNVNVGLSGDMLLMLQIVKDRSYKVCSDSIAIYSSDGVSNTETFRLLRSHFIVVKYFNLSLLKYIILNNLFIIKCIFKIIMPFGLIRVYRRFISINTPAGVAE